ncbi:MAG: adenylyltransferase/cytidyltransferase family protein [Candidatus Ratteibacteria bacterium]|nr:adenylyltransferase/cytidyltransferase family protein [Candidatus Ratteibacteria bacterium]
MTRRSKISARRKNSSAGRLARRLVGETVCVSGYFNPLHKGHVRYFKAAKKLADRLIVIVNNDRQVEMKGSTPFMDEEERMEIVSAIEDVDEAVIAIDTDGTVIETLKSVKPDIFAKGGDRTLANIPEKEICEKLGIKIVTGVGGGKVQSSSKLLKKLYGKD